MTFRVQNQIRNNATEIRSYLDDLFTWEEEINGKQGGKKPTKSTTNAKQNNKENFPIRGQALADESSDNNEEERQLADSKPDNEEIQNVDEANKNLRRDVNSIPKYYEEWDKFAKHGVDKELEKLEKQAGNKVVDEKKLPQPANPMQRTSGAERNTKIVIKGGRTSYNEVESLKEKGNLYFKSHEFDKAVEMYTEAISKGEVQKVNDELKVILYSNRAMAYLKLREYLKAEEDCNCSLKLNEKHVKSLVRRGQAKRRLEKYKESLRDCEKAGEIEPENKEIQDEIKALNKKLATIKEEQKKKLVLPVSVTEKPKISVKVEDYDPDQQETEKSISNKAEHSTKNVALDNTAFTTPVKVESSNKPTIDPNTGEATSEFLTLKDVEGKLVKHHELEPEEAVKQQVHFRLDLNKEETGYKTIYPPVSLEKKPKKSALKKKRLFGKENQEEPNKVKKDVKITELKTAKAVQQGKELWHKQVIEGYEQISQPKTNGQNVQTKEDTKKIVNIATSSEFLNTWKHIKDSDEACEKLLMGQAKPERFAQIFAAGIEFDLFMELIKFAQRFTEKNKKLVLDILEGMGKVKRFDINVKSMLSSEKKVLREIVEKVKGSEEVDQEVVGQISQKYKL